MSERKWTPEQQAAIEARGGTLLVSAAAGSGKTAVLVARLMGILTDKVKPVDADRLLVVTFSNAAAQEMRQRLSAALSKALASEPENPHLLRQLLLLQRSHISTVHAYCLELIRANFHLLHISPSTKPGDEKEMLLLRRDVQKQVIERFYAEDKTFPRLVELFSTGRDDKTLFTVMDKLYDFLRAQPFYRDKLTRWTGMYHTDLPPEQTLWGVTVREYAAQLVSRCIANTESCLTDCSTDVEMSPKIAEVLNQDRETFLHLKQVMGTATWDEIRLALDALKFSSWPRGTALTPAAQLIRSRREQTKKIAEKLSGGKRKAGIFCVSTAEFQEDCFFFRPLLQQLCDLLLAFDDAFMQVKQKRALMDFSDMEHYALALLTQKQDDGTYLPSELAGWLREDFDEILVDEYQDTNQVQDTIFTALSKDSQNLFMVGDVKQSIYRFRQACPELFLEKKNIYTPFDGVSYPAVLRLGKNFRSAPEVTEGVNFLFSRLMSERFAQIEYDQQEALYPGREFPAGGERFTQIRLLDLSEQPDVEPMRAEAAHVAQSIRNLVDSGALVTAEDGVNLRAVGWGDVCVLLRSAKGRTKLYLDALGALGIPAWAESRDGFLGSSEVSPLVHLLRVLANPLLDISMGAVLLSPLFGATPDLLSVIRGKYSDRSLYHGVLEQSKARKNHVLCRHVTAVLKRLRQVYATGSAEDVVLAALDLCDYMGKVRVMPGGGSRADNVMLFLQYARQYGGGTGGAAAFASFLGRLDADGEDLPPAVTGAQGGDVVRVMTIHRSKGLEFPVVYLCDCAKAFNRGDYTGNALWNSELGFGFARRDVRTKAVYQTLPLTALKLAQEQASLAEELRMLYVALTRAKERLILTGTMTSTWEKCLSQWKVSLEQGKIPPDAMRGGGCYLDWVMMAALHHDNAAYLDCAAPPRDLPESDAAFQVQIATLGQQEQTAQVIRRLNAVPEPVLRQKNEEQIAFTYPYTDETRAVSKMAVSTLVKGNAQATHRFSSRPAFLEEGGLSNAAKGSAMHTFMQFADYKNAAADPIAEVRRLVELGFLSQGEGNVIDCPRITAFFQSELASRIFAAEKVHRELRFLAKVDSEIVSQYMEDFPQTCRLTVQGIADCVFIEQGQAVVVDYKTDVVRSAQALSNRYRGQLAVYKLILEESLGVPVKECVLYSFHLSKTIKVKLKDTGEQ